MIRRAARAGRILELEEGAMGEVVKTVVESMVREEERERVGKKEELQSGAYPEVGREGLEKVIEDEEKKYWRVLERGKKRVKEEIEKLDGNRVMKGEICFPLKLMWDT